MSTKQLEKEATSEKKDKQLNKKVRKSNEAATKTDPVTRREIKKQERLEKKQAKQKEKKPRRRIFPIWLRIIVVTILCALALLAGVMIGYGILGDGKPTDALKVETWQHIINIVTEEK